MTSSSTILLNKNNFYEVISQFTYLLQKQKDVVLYMPKLWDDLNFEDSNISDVKQTVIEMKKSWLPDDFISNFQKSYE